jgi:CheY-like chemotaxis protein
VQRCILIIEDNKDNYYLMQYLLEARGYKVIGADSGWMGIELAVYNNPDIILLDIQLPEMDGYAIMRRLRSTSELAKVPIVAVSSYAMANSKQLAMDSGADGYIEKPIDPDSFADEIQAFMDQAAPRESL